MAVARRCRSPVSTCSSCAPDTAERPSPQRVRCSDGGRTCRQHLLCSRQSRRRFVAVALRHLRRVARMDRFRGPALVGGVLSKGLGFAEEEIWQNEWKTRR